MTVREFTNKAWYACKIVIIKSEEYDKCNDIDEVKKKSLMYGDNSQLRSINYENVNMMIVESFGVIDNVLVIEVQ